MVLSLIVPVYNEAGSLPRFIQKTTQELDKLGLTYEVIAVDDGSSDESFSILQNEAKRSRNFKVIKFSRNEGQTAAMMAGFDFSVGDVICPIDADLQNDPSSIRDLLAELDKGYDVVSGWRKDRKDSLITRNFVSMVANKLISKISGLNLHDFGCSLKVYKREVVQDMRLYGEMHRFIPIYAYWNGARVTELKVKHNPRQYGVSKYGLARIFKVVLDLLTIKFLDKFLVKPIYVFGGVGFAFLMFSLLSLFYSIYLKLFFSLSMIQTPLPVVTAMFFVTGVLSILLGVIAELVMRTYFESQRKKTFRITERLNFE